MWIIDFLCGRKCKPTNELRIESPLDDSIFSVENFNEWFVDPNNGAVYAHRGIFLRLDKLSMSHIEDYLEKKYGITKTSPLYEKSNLYLLMMDFRELICIDWRKKIKNI